MTKPIIVGERRNNLEFVHKFKDGSYTKYKCLCLDCGRDTIIHANNFGKNKNCGCTKKNRSRKVGDVKNGLTIIEKLYKGNVVTKLKCYCSHCGNNAAIIPYTMFGRQQSCGCFDVRTHKNHPNFKGYEGIYSEMWKQLHSNATKRNLEFTITIEYAWQLFIMQNKKCALSGIEIQMWPGSHYLERSKGTASLDRIDNKLGYVVGNVQWVHKDVNRMKSDFLQSEFITWCIRIAKNENN